MSLTEVASDQNFGNFGSIIYGGNKIKSGTP